MTLNEVMKETADAIREKTGKSELIAPIDFASEIKGITSGGGDAPSGGLKYYINDDPKVGLFPLAASFLTKYDTGDAILFSSSSTLAMELGSDVDMNSIKAFAFDPSAKVGDINNNPSNIVTMMELWEGFELHEITKEQFYTLE